MTNDERVLGSEVRTHYDGLASAYDTQANQACKRAYEELVLRFAAGAQRVLELGAGSGQLLSLVPAPFKLACDFSSTMLAAHRKTFMVRRLNADAQRLPLRGASFDFVFCVNVLEHVAKPQHVVAEAARVLVPRGRFLAITPNGDLAWLLELLERLHIKLPEGPHRFLTFDELASLAGGSFRLLEHRRFLAFPAGPPGVARWMDKLLSRGRGRGLFYYVLMEKGKQ